MAKQPVNNPVNHRVDSPWLSSVLLLAAYTTYGGFLHSTEAAPPLWGVSIIFALLLAAGCTIGWGICRRFLLLGFQSDVGYFVMALAISSLAVAAVSQFRMFTYLSLLVAVALLTRIDMLVANFTQVRAFFAMVSISLLGLGFAWVPHLLQQSAHVGAV